MDLHSLSRKELQSLCKKNKIPANMTNVAMADALTALTNVEGIEEIGRLTSGSEKSQLVPDSPYMGGRQSSRRRAAKDPVVPIENDEESNMLLSRTRTRTRRIIQDEEQEAKDPKDLSENPSVPESPLIGLRASSRRRPVENPDVSIKNNTESSKPLIRTRCRTRRIDQEEEQENKDSNNLTENPSGEVILKTPATRNGRRRTTGASIIKANEKDEKYEQDRIVTRRSARLQSKMPDANQKPGRRTEAVQIAALSEEETEYVSKKSGSSGITCLAPDQISPEKTLCSEPEEYNASTTQGDLVSEDATINVVSAQILGGRISSLVPEPFAVEETLNSEAYDSEAEDSIALVKKYRDDEDTSAPVVSAEDLQCFSGLASECSTEQKTHKNIETVTESSENIESKNVVELGLQVIAEDDQCEEVYCELPSLGVIVGEMLSGIESGNGISDQDLDNGCVGTDQEVQSTGDFKGNGIDDLGLQVIKEGVYADGSSKIPSSVSEICDFGLMKDSIQECFLNGLGEGQCDSDLVPLDIEALGKGLVLEQDAGMELSALPDDMKLGTGEFGQIGDAYDADPVATASDTATILCSYVSGTEECSEKSDIEMSLGGDTTKSIRVGDMHKSSPPLICDVGLLDEIPLSSATVRILSQVPSCLSPSRGVVSESRYQLNQNNVTLSRSSSKKKATTPSQRRPFIMVLDENKGDNYSGGTSLRKKSNSKVLTAAAEEKENRENYSVGLSLRSKSNSEVIVSVVQEKENKENYSGGLSLRNKSNSKVKVITSVAEEMENNKKFEDSVQRTLKNTSLRQLKKMFKEKLLVGDNTGDNKNNVVKV